MCTLDALRWKRRTRLLSRPILVYFLHCSAADYTLEGNIPWGSAHIPFELVGHPMHTQSGGARDGRCTPSDRPSREGGTVPRKRRSEREGSRGRIGRAGCASPCCSPRTQKSPTLLRHAANGVTTRGIGFQNWSDTVKMWSDQSGPKLTLYLVHVHLRGLLRVPCTQCDNILGEAFKLGADPKEQLVNPGGSTSHRSGPMARHTPATGSDPASTAEGGAVGLEIELGHAIKNNSRSERRQSMNDIPSSGRPRGIKEMRPRQPRLSPEVRAEIIRSAVVTG